jgi:hypothetical protein
MGWRCVTSHIKFHAMRPAARHMGLGVWFVSGAPSAETKCCSFTTDRRMRTGRRREKAASRRKAHGAVLARLGEQEPRAAQEGELRNHWLQGGSGHQI